MSIKLLSDLSKSARIVMQATEEDNLIPEVLGYDDVSSLVEYDDIHSDLPTTVWNFTC